MAAETPPAKGRMKQFAVEQDGSVVRSADWRVSVADFATVAYLGRDFDIGLYALFPGAVSLGGFGNNQVGPSQVELKQQFAETARVRMGPAGVAQLTMNLILNMRESEPQAYQELRGHIETFLAQDGETAS